MPSIAVHTTTLKDALVLEPKAFSDQRGFFKEVFRASSLAEVGIDLQFVQDNVSYSTRGVLRGLHLVPGMSKLLQVISGHTYNVIADMRPDSPTYLRWEAFELSGENHKQLFVPDGFANGFCVLSDEAYVYYKQDAYYDTSREQIVRWNDPILGVKWPTDAPVMSDKDRLAPDYPPR